MTKAVDITRDGATGAPLYLREADGALYALRRLPSDVMPSREFNASAEAQQAYVLDEQAQNLAAFERVARFMASAAFKPAAADVADLVRNFGLRPRATAPGAPR